MGVDNLIKGVDKKYIDGIKSNFHIFVRFVAMYIKMQGLWRELKYKNVINMKNIARSGTSINSVYLIQWLLYFPIFSYVKTWVHHFFMENNHDWLFNYEISWIYKYPNTSDELNLNFH